MLLALDFDFVLSISTTLQQRKLNNLMTLKAWGKCFFCLKPLSWYENTISLENESGPFEALLCSLRNKRVLPREKKQSFAVTAIFCLLLTLKALNDPSSKQSMYFAARFPSFLLKPHYLDSGHICCRCFAPFKMVSLKSAHRFLVCKDPIFKIKSVWR